MSKVIYADERQYVLLEGRDEQHLGRYSLYRDGKLALITTDRNEALQKSREPLPPLPVEELPRWVLWLVMLLFVLVMLYVCFG